MLPKPSRLPLFLAAVLCSAAPLAAQGDPLGPPADRLARSRQQAVNFLKTTQNADGSWTGKESLGITAVVTIALLEQGLPADDPAVARALEFLLSNVKPDGGIYAEGSSHRNYEAALSLTALSTADARQYAKPIAGAQRFLKELQWDEGEGLTSSDINYGGAGYGGGGDRPDLSNTQFLIEALKTSGLDEGDDAFRKALVFVSRSQNLESEYNTTEFAPKINDGGFFYTPAVGGQSKAGTTPDGGLRSYGSMTYAGLKSMVYAGLTADDPRVRAAFEWARSHYTMTENPGMGQQGLYYYYMTLGRTLDTLEVGELIDADRVVHDWREDMAEQLFRAQKPNGSWVNEADRWYEGDPNLVTAYALIALSKTEPVERGVVGVGE